MSGLVLPIDFIYAELHLLKPSKQNSERHKATHANSNLHILPESALYLMVKYNYQTTGSSMMAKFSIRALSLIALTALVTPCTTLHARSSAKESRSSVTLPKGAHKVATAEEYQQIIKQAAQEGKPVVIQVSTEWCSACKALKPAMEEAIKKHKDGVKFIYLDGDSRELRSLLDQMNIRGFPTVIYRSDELTADGAMVAGYEGKVVGSSPSPLDEINSHIDQAKKAVRSKKAEASATGKKKSSEPAQQPAKKAKTSNFGVQEIKSGAEFEGVLKAAAEAHKPVVIKIYASWCSACKNMQEPYAAVARELGDAVEFLAINVDTKDSRLRSYAHANAKQGVPTIVYRYDKMAGTKIVTEYELAETGGVSKLLLKERVQALQEKAAQPKKKAAAKKQAASAKKKTTKKSN
jgi:thiol-disulfide isomerase/thioredoxin